MYKKLLVYLWFKLTDYILLQYNYRHKYIIYNIMEYLNNLLFVYLQVGCKYIFIWLNCVVLIIPTLNDIRIIYKLFIWWFN